MAMVNPSALGPEGLGLLRVDPERRFFPPPGKTELGRVERVNLLSFELPTAFPQSILAQSSPSLGHSMTNRLLKNAHLRRYPVASLSRRRGKKSLLLRRDATLRISGALHPGIFDHPAKNESFNKLLMAR
jgi:hypothetical protein